MKKKILVLALATIMACSLVACGGKDSSKTTDNTKTQSQSQKDEKQNEKASEEKETKKETAVTPNTPDNKEPEGKTKYVMEGGVVYYPTDTWTKGDFGGMQPKDCEDDSLVVRLGTVAGSVDKQIEVFKDEYRDYQTIEKMTIANHNAVKLIYVGNLGTHMQIVFDTPYTNDEFYSAYDIWVSVSEDNTAFFDDPTLWEIIESFYYDPALKYSF